MILRVLRPSSAEFENSAVALRLKGQFSQSQSPEGIKDKTTHSALISHADSHAQELL